MVSTVMLPIYADHRASTSNREYAQAEASQFKNSRDKFFWPSSKQPNKLQADIKQPGMIVYCYWL